MRALAPLVLLAACATPPEAPRFTGPADSPVPISTSVRTPPGSRLVFVSGTLPAVADPSQPAGSPARFGDTETQTRSTLARIGQALAAEGLTFKDVVQARVFLVGDPAREGRMDFAGMNRAYGEVFGAAAQPNKPARTTVQVTALPLPGALVEIEVVAVAP